MVISASATYCIILFKKKANNKKDLFLLPVLPPCPLQKIPKLLKHVQYLFFFRLKSTPSSPPMFIYWSLEHN